MLHSCGTRVVGLWHSCGVGLHKLLATRPDPHGLQGRCAVMSAEAVTCWRGDVCVCALLCPWETGEQDLKEEDEDWKSCVAKVFNWKKSSAFLSAASLLLIAASALCV